MTMRELLRALQGQRLEPSAYSRDEDVMMNVGIGQLV